MFPGHHIPQHLNGLIHVIYLAVVPDERIVSDPVRQAISLYHIFKQLVCPANPVSLAETIDQTVVGDNVGHEALEQHVPEHVVCLPDPPPYSFPAPCLHPSPAIGADEYCIGVRVRWTPESRELHLLQQEPGFLHVPNPAQCRDHDIVGPDVRLAAKLLHSVECRQGLLGEAFLSEHLDDGRDSFGAHYPLILPQERPEPPQKIGLCEDPSHFPACGLPMDEPAVGLDPGVEFQGFVDPKPHPSVVAVGSGTPRALAHARVPGFEVELTLSEGRPVAGGGLATNRAGAQEEVAGDRREDVNDGVEAPSRETRGRSGERVVLYHSGHYLADEKIGGVTASGGKRGGHHFQRRDELKRCEEGVNPPS